MGNDTITHLSDLPALMVSSNESDAVGVANLHNTGNLEVSEHLFRQYLSA